MPKASALGCPLPRSNLCPAPEITDAYNGTYSVTSIGGVASTFLLEWLRHLQLAGRHSRDCTRGDALPAEKALFGETCGCPALADGASPLHLVSCHVDDDGVFKHLADPRELNRFANHRALYVVGDPIEAVASVFRRNFQCWHLYRLSTPAAVHARAHPTRTVYLVPLSARRQLLVYACRARRSHPVRAARYPRLPPPLRRGRLDVPRAE